MAKTGILAGVLGLGMLVVMVVGFIILWNGEYPTNWEITIVGSICVVLGFVLGSTWMKMYTADSEWPKWPFVKLKDTFGADEQ